MTSRVPAWVKVGPAPHLATCQRCGGHIENPTLPMEMGAFVRYLEDQGGRHRSCQEAQP